MAAFREALSERCCLDPAIDEMATAQCLSEEIINLIATGLML